MILFRKIRWRNFLSTGNIFTEIDLNRSNATLILGHNGAGKSTLLCALCFALFGKPFRNTNKPLLVNSINKKDCLVEIEFQINTKHYRIVRGIKPNIFEIYCDGLLIDQDAASRDYQEFLEKNILKFNYKSFTQIVILGSASFVPFMQLTAQDRRSIIEDLLDIKIFSSMNVVVKDRLNINKNLITDVKRDIDNVNAQIDLQKKYTEETEKNNQLMIEAKENAILENQANISDILAKIQEHEKEIQPLQLEIAAEVAVKGKLQKLTQLEAKIENNIQKIEKDIEFFKVNSTCPTCDQEIHNQEEKIQEYGKKTEEFNSGLQKLKIEIADLSSKVIMINGFNKKISEINSEISAKNASIFQIQKYISKLNSEISDLRKSKPLSDNMENLSQSLSDRLLDLEKKLKAALEEKNYIEIAAYLLKDNGIKTKIIKQYLPIINKFVNKYLSAMNFFINFEIDEEFKERIKSRFRDDFCYENFSEGEKMRIDLALLFTWRAIAKMKNSINTNLLILDEVFDSSLDTNGTEEFTKLLQAFGQETNIFVISHKGDMLMDKFKNVIKFAKVKNFSTIVQ